MTFIAPTAAEIIAVYPQFEGHDAAIDMALMESSFIIGQEWGELCDTEEEGQKLFTLAHNFYIAHILTLEGVGAANNTEAALAASGLSGFDTIRSGELSISRSSGGQSASSGIGSQDPLAQTLYGRRFIELRNRLFAGPRVVNVTGYAF